MKKYFYAFMFCLWVSCPASGQNVHAIHLEGMDSCSMTDSPLIGERMRLKTNFLYDMLLVSNATVELGIGNSWTIGVGFWYSWHSNNPLHRYWRSYGEEISVRKYYSRHRIPFMGHHVGVSYQIGIYDVENGRRGYMSDLSFSMGAEYGYSFHLSPWASMDLAVAFGYFCGKYMVYDPMDSHYVWKENRFKNYVGPVKTEVTFGFLLNKEKKGGLR